MPWKSYRQSMKPEALLKSEWLSSLSSTIIITITTITAIIGEDRGLLLPPVIGTGGITITITIITIITTAIIGAIATTIELMAAGLRRCRLFNSLASSLLRREGYFCRYYRILCLKPKSSAFLPTAWLGWHGCGERATHAPRTLVRPFLPPQHPILQAQQ